MPKIPSLPPPETALLLVDAPLEAEADPRDRARWTASSPRSRRSSASDDHARPIRRTTRAAA